MTSNQVMDHNYIKLGQLCRLLKTQNRVKLSQFETIVKNNFDVNYKLPPNSVLSQNNPEYSGNTVINFIARSPNYYDYFENSCLAMLLNIGADLTITNDKDYTPLLQAFYEDSNVILLLEAHYESDNSTNLKCKNGLSHFHVACSLEPDDFYNIVEIVDFFLEGGAFVNERVGNSSSYYPGYTPLHIAAEHGCLEMIELLLLNGADINILNAKEMTPLQILIKNIMGKKDWQENIEMQKFFMKVACNNKCEDVGLWLGYLEYILQSNNSVDQILNQEIDTDTFITFDSKICPGYTLLHLASHFNLKSVKSLLLKGADLLAKDANGVTPLDICLKKFDINDILDILIVEKRHQLLQIKFTDGTLLLDALQAMTKPVALKQFLNRNFKNINTFIPFSSLIWPGYNFLHLGILFDGCISELLSNNADFTMQNMDGLSPLHLAVSMRREKAVAEILQAHKRLPSNTFNRGNLSHLHIACAAGDVVLVKLLLLNGADPNLPTLSNFYGHCYKRSVFIKTGSTPLHVAVDTEEFELIKMLLDYKANPYVANADGLTPFENALYKYQCWQDKPFKIILNHLLETDLETFTIGVIGIKTLRIALTSRNKPDETALRLVQEFDKKNPYEELGLTRLQVACCIGDLTMVQEEINSGVDVNQCISLDSAIWPGDSAMHILFRRNPSQTDEITKLLLAQGANPTLKNSHNLTPIHLFEDKTLQTVISLLGNNFTNVNPANNEGLSHFHLSCKTTNVHIIKGFLESGVDVNAVVDHFDEDYPGWTPLHFAICYSNEEVVELLLNHGADPKIINADGLDPLHMGVLLNLGINTQNLDAIMRHPAVNIQDTSLFGDTTLMTALKSDEVNDYIIDYLQNKGACVNLIWSTVKSLDESKFFLKWACKLSSKIFQRLIAIIPAITATDSKGRNVFHHFSRFDDKISNISYYKENFKILIEIGCEIDQKDIKGI